MMFWRYEVTGVDTVTLHFGDRIDIALADRVHQAAAAIAADMGDRLMDIVPSYTTVLLRYDLSRDDLSSLLRDVSDTLADLPATGSGDSDGEVVDIPVYYDPSVGPDLADVADRAGMTVDQVIGRHSGELYHVFAIGFAPGFAYLGQVPEALAVPRQSTPRPKVPAGTLGIADTQTALYPLASPGGWNLIGRTPVTLFDPGRDQPSLLQAGQKVRFVPISRERYLELGGRLDDLPWREEAQAPASEGGQP